MATTKLDQEQDVIDLALGEVLDDMKRERPAGPGQPHDGLSASKTIRSPAYRPVACTSAVSHSREDPARPYSRLRWLGIATGLCFAIAFLSGGLDSWNPFAKSHSPSMAASPNAVSQSRGPVTKAIDDVRVGDRVIGTNPIREQAELVEPTPDSWRRISLTMTKDGGRSLWIELLRPVAWTESHNAAIGESIYLDLEEMGAVGYAHVTGLGPCPKIKSGEGTIVTGTFKHESDSNSKVVRLRLERQAEATGVTTNHPYWSVDRQAFVPVGELQEGERVDTYLGESRVVSITVAEYSGYLYNLETLEHVYRVGSLGTTIALNRRLIIAWRLAKVKASIE